MNSASIDLFSDILLGVGALGAAFYCIILSKKLTKLTGLDQEMGGAIALLSQQVDDMTNALEIARSSAIESEEKLMDLTARAEEIHSILDNTLRAESLRSRENADSPLQPSLADGAPSMFFRHSSQSIQQ